MENTNMKIEWIAIENLNASPNNSKIHTRKQIKNIANSIEQFGFNDPLAVFGENNTILEGNGRLEAAKLLDMKIVPCIRLEHLSDEERRAYLIAHNSLCLETGFDDAVLFAELKELQNYDFSDFGLETEKYLKTIDELQRKELQPISKIHYLVSVDLNHHYKIVEYIAKLRETEGVEILETQN